MIVVSVRYCSKELRAIAVKGHADPQVCAGVSSCFVGACNALVDEENIHVHIEGGNSSIQADKKLNDHDAIVIETLLVQLRTIEEKYPKEIVVRVSGKKGQEK